MTTSTKGRRAVVLGGGIAGLGAAGVLARHFEEVHVVERDAYPETPGVRPHAAQGAHVHVLLAKGLEVFTRLVPQLTGWLDELDLPEADLTYDVRMAYGGRWLPRVRSGLAFRPCTRPEIEHLLRRDVTGRPNVTVLGEHKAESLLGTKRVRGVRVSHAGSERDIEADLVVDAMGRGSPSTRFLDAAGLPPVPEDKLDAGVVYASCMFEAETDLDLDWTLLGVSCRVPDQPFMGAVMRFGRRRALVALIGYGKPKPPRTPEELVERTAGLCVPEVHRMLRASKPVSELAVFSNTFNRWRRFGRLPWFPDGLLSIGDAACSLNPRYGQGMTVASLSAERLDAELSSYFAARGGLDGFAHAFQKQQEGVLAVPWRMATMEDRLWSTVFSGRKPGLAERAMMKGMERVLQAVFTDIDAYVTFLRVAHLIDSPTKLLHPRFLRAVAMGSSGAVPTEAPRIFA